MSKNLIEIIQNNSRPLITKPTGVVPRLPQFDNIKAVIFDIYGTLLISGTGDISQSSGKNHGEVLKDLLGRLGIDEQGDKLWTTFCKEIQKAQMRSSAKHPEVEIREVWKAFLEDYGCKNLSEEEIEELALLYEVKVNSVWLMPGIEEMLKILSKKKDLALGVISNAQFYSPLYFEALLQKDLAELGFDSELRVFSYHALAAKPGQRLYQIMKENLVKKGIRPEEALYIGNDRLKDVDPAAKVGFKTVLFAGDKRSLRLREEKEGLRCEDAVVSHLSQIPSLLNTG